LSTLSTTTSNSAPSGEKTGQPTLSALATRTSCLLVGRCTTRSAPQPRRRCAHAQTQPSFVRAPANAAHVSSFNASDGVKDDGIAGGGVRGLLRQFGNAS